MHRYRCSCAVPWRRWGWLVLLPVHYHTLYDTIYKAFCALTDIFLIDLTIPVYREWSASGGAGGRVPLVQTGGWGGPHSGGRGYHQWVYAYVCMCVYCAVYLQYSHMWLREIEDLNLLYICLLYVSLYLYRHIRIYMFIGHLITKRLMIPCAHAPAFAAYPVGNYSDIPHAT